MNAELAQTVLNRIANLSQAGAAAPVEQLQTIYELIEEQRCFCGGGWKRGGKRQGSELCETCWQAD